MDEKISKLFLPLLDKLYNTEPAGEPFRRPVDVVKYGCFDYYLYVKHPIDLSTIREKLLTNQYKEDAWRFIADIQLMFSNAYLFNKKGTPVYEFTNKLNKIWNQELTPIMQRLNYCCGTLHKFGPQLLFCHGTTQDRYCQIPIGAKYKCYEDQYSFCMTCFNKINSEFVNIQNLSCETSRMKLPTQPVKKSDFKDCANDLWQYEQFVKCTKCTRRVHQICDLYPAKDDEIDDCIQHEQIEEEQKMLCQVPEEYRLHTEEQEENLTITATTTTATTTTTAPFNTTVSLTSTTTICSDQDHHHIAELKQQTENNNNNKKKTKTPKDTSTNDQENEQQIKLGEQNIEIQELSTQTNSDQAQHQAQPSSTSLDDELLQFAKDVDDFTNSAPASPNPSRVEGMKDTTGCQKKTTTSNAKNSVDKIAARLSIHKMNAETNHVDDRSDGKKDENDYVKKQSRDKFVCNHCYRKEKIGLDLRHRKYSARRLPHTRMSRYIETKVNEHIREHSPTAGEVTIRVLTAYQDILSVKTEMKNYVRKCRNNDSIYQHPNAKNYPDEFNYMNRALFAWQEIDGVDVCVFGMHVQEYGDDCPEPNKRVIYLSYLDSVHFFRPKQVRTTVYHEILLSYFKYVKKLGFRRVFIWVCPSRKGDDYIFYRHPTEQKMPTLKRLSDWYVNLLDKGIMAGIVEKHHTIHQYASSQNWNSILSMPYLSGDYWPGEFERLLNIMIESQKVYEKRKQEEMKDNLLNENMTEILDISDMGGTTSNSIDRISIINNNFNRIFDKQTEQSNILSLTSIYQKASTNLSNGKLFNMKNSLINSYTPFKSTNGPAGMCYTPDAGDFGNISMNDDFKSYLDNPFTPNSSKTDSDQPLDLSKSSLNTSPESFYGERLTPFSNNISNPCLAGKKRRRKSNSMGYTKKRSRFKGNTSASQIAASQNVGSFKPNNNTTFPSCESFNSFLSQPAKSINTRQKSSTQSRDSSQPEQLLSPEEELAKNLERSLRRQREGFIVARLSECDCSPHFENQRRKEEATFTCEMMKGREPFLQLARTKNYEFSSLRRAKFSSLAMIKHLGQSFKLEPICNECFSFDSSKRHYACSVCDDFYLCTSCHEMSHHEHNMSIVPPLTLPDIDEFLQPCSSTSTTNSISSASSTISNKSFNESNSNIATQPVTPISRRDLTETSTPLNRQLSNSLTSSVMPLSCKLQKNQSLDVDSKPLRTENEENAEICPFDSSTTKLILPNQTVPPPSHSPNSNFELDQVLVENFIRHAEVSYDVDFEQMKNESEKLLTHYRTCPIKEVCHKCKFVVLSCSFMSVLMKSTRMQMMINFNPSEILPINSNNNNTNTSNNNSNNNNNNNSHHSNGINLTTANRYIYQQKDKK